MKFKYRSDLFVSKQKNKVKELAPPNYLSTYNLRNLTCRVRIRKTAPKG